MNNTRLKRCAIFLIFALVVPFAGAQQPIYTFVPCLDTMAINSRYVLVAQIAEIHATVFDGADNNVIVSIEKSLKGGQSGKLELRIDASPAALAAWKESSSRLLLFDGDANPSTGAGKTNKPIDLSSSNLKILTADMKVLIDPEQVLQAAQKAISRHSSANGIYTIDTFTRSLPPETAKALGAKISPYTNVPVDPELERWAQSVIRGKTTGRRAESVAALRYFKSKENIRLLTPLLNDPTWVYLKSAEENMGVEIRVYNVREAAYQVLKNWGVNVVEPVVQEQKLKLESVTQYALSNKKDFVHHADIDALSGFPNLQTICLQNDHQMTVECFRSLGTLKTLRTIDLTHSNVNDERLTYLANLPNLESLILNGTKITDEGLKTIGEFAALTNLDVTGTNVTWAAVAELRVRRPDLKIEFGR
jgi:hypothetical protein